MSPRIGDELDENMLPLLRRPLEESVDVSFSINEMVLLINSLKCCKLANDSCLSRVR